ncbi:alcohol dehydrogenase [Sporothrix brasiliensis 5110]|uniref:Alcohol dehydrogenase n=1 Tax=Sporothrix brasiliensis 5110 TaxID=1398154 RepID=A0A0C2IPF3_9PEZI|nr:alcohol dehydrogenase [Sporothrix brasiliensis 5110]KIH86952.1 alcohol dehydrogenase [Sporothrix brasiliensis 5110]
MTEEEGDNRTTMLALVHDPATGGLTLSDVPMPVPTGPDEHLIQVHAVALTNGELKWPEPAAQETPIPGYEVSGTVIEAPNKSSPFQPGTEVYALTDFNRQGNACEYAIVLTGELRQKPEALSWEEAATVPLSALTAWQVLFVHGGLTLPTEPVTRPPTPPQIHASPPRPPSLQRQHSHPYSRQQSPASRPSSRPSSSHRPRSIVVGDDVNANKRVLITAAAGGVGLWAVQLARLAGVGHITATCGPANIDFVRSLGAHRVIDYTTLRNTGEASSGNRSAGTREEGGSGRNSPSTAHGRTRSSSQSRYGAFYSSSDKYDLVLDCVGGDTLKRAWTSSRHGGTVISIVMPPDKLRPETGVGMDVRGVFFIVHADSEQLQAITDLIETRAVKAVFDSAFQLEQYEAAFAKVQSGHVRGKVVLRLA